MENLYFKLLSEDYFADNSLEVINIIIKLLRSLLDQHIHEFPRIIEEILNEIRDPLIAIEDSSNENSQSSLLSRKNQLIRKVEVIDQEIDAMENERERHIERGEYNAAIIIKQEINSKDKEAQIYEQELIKIEQEIISILYRALIIITVMLKEVKHGVIVLDISEFVKNLVLPALDIPQGPIQIIALECLTQCCLHDIEICKNNLEIFIKILEKQSESILEFIVIISVIDIYMV